MSLACTRVDPRQVELQAKKDSLFQELNALNNQSADVRRRIEQAIPRRNENELRGLQRELEEVGVKRERINSELNRVLAELGKDPV